MSLKRVVPPKPTASPSIEIILLVSKNQAAKIEK
jgi:hypothetical protein